MARNKRSKKGKLNRVGRRRRNIRIFLVLVIFALVGAFGYQLHRADMVPANQTAAEWYESREKPLELVSLPRDDAPHDKYTEWWYYNGHLQAQDGRQYSFHYVIFVINRLAGHTVAHASFVDHESGQHFTAQQRTAGKPNQDMQDGFDFDFSNWKMAGSDGSDQLSLETPDFSFNLALENVNPPVLHGRTGLLDFAQAGSSYYYSRARMRVTGTAGIDGNNQLVSGEAWFDHQWGDFRVTALAWNWFAIQFDDGRDLMLFELFTPQGKKVVFFGTLSGKDMADVVLEQDDFEVHVNDYWYSEKTRINYPMGWRVKVPGSQVDVTLDPVIRDAEFDGRASSYLIYWEGPVEVSGSHTGRGYVEMSGYLPSDRPTEADQSASGQPAEAPTAPVAQSISTEAPDMPADGPVGRTALVNTDRLNVRTGPGPDFDVLLRLNKGTRVKIVEQKGDWLRIELFERNPVADIWVFSDLVAIN